MTRAFAICAVLLTVRGTSAQTVTPTIIAEPAEPTLAPTTSHGVSACNAPSCRTSVADAATQPARDEHALLRQKLAELNCLQSEIAELRRATGTPQQVLISIKAIEVSRTKCKQQGIVIASLIGENAHTAPASFSTGFTIVPDSRTLLSAIDQLQENNLAKIIAEPNLAVVCGRPAKFHVGGEIPIPAGPANEIAEFKPFGTQVDVLATALGDERVQLELDARVSEIDPSNQQQVGNLRVPGVNVRQVKSGFDMKFGQAAVISGSVQTRTERRQTGTKTVDQTDEIELLFIVTVEGVPPANGDPLEAAPNDGTYRTATTDSENLPAERSLRVNAPRTAR